MRKVGAAVAAWPAASLVGSYELLLWLIRTASANTPACVPGRGPTSAAAHHHAAELRLLATPATSMPAVPPASSDQRMPDQGGSVGRASGPERTAMAEASQVARHDAATGQHADPGDSEEKANATAVAAYRASIDNGKPICERRPAAMFGKTSRRRTRHRMAEARHVPATVRDMP